METAVTRILWHDSRRDEDHEFLSPAGIEITLEKSAHPGDVPKAGNPATVTGGFGLYQSTHGDGGAIPNPDQGRRLLDVEHRCGGAPVRRQFCLQQPRQDG